MPGETAQLKRREISQFDYKKERLSLDRPPVIYHSLEFKNFLVGPRKRHVRRLTLCLAAPHYVLGTMDLPGQFFPVDETLTREVVDERVAAVRSLYAEDGGRHRTDIHARLSGFYDDFEASAKHVLFDVLGVREE